MPKATTQIKFTTEPDIVGAFRTRRESEWTSMAPAVRRWMISCQPTKDVKIKILARPQRRKAAAEYIGLLNALSENEAGYRDNIPEQFTQRYDDAAHSCEKPEEAIECLEEAF